MDARNAFDVKIGALPRPCVQCTLIGTDVTLGLFQTRTGAQNVRQGIPANDGEKNLVTEKYTMR